MPLGTPLRRMPIPEDVGDFMTKLLGASSSASKVRKAQFEEDATYFSAYYVEDDDRLGGACIVDLPLAATLGTSLAMMPAVLAKEIIAKGELVDDVRDNFYEVANIVTRLLNSPSVPHLRITEVVDGVPADLVDFVEAAPGNRCFDLTVLGYPGGRMWLLAADPDRA